MKVPFLLLIVVTLLTGCAVGNKIDYSITQIAVNQSTNNGTGLGVQDKRAYVISKKKKGSFIGVYRGGFGNPFDVNTSSNKDFSIDIEKVIARSIIQSGGQVIPFTIEVTASNEEILRIAKSTNSAKTLVVTINEWKSDSTNSFSHRVTNFDFDLVATVYDSNLNQLAMKAVKGTEQVVGGAFGGFSYVQEAAPKVLKAKLDELLSGEISSALNSN